MWGGPRVARDGLVLNAAQAAGVVVRQPARAEAMDVGAKPAVRVRDLVTNVVERLEADRIIVADGKAALLGDGPPPPTGDFGIKAHFTNVNGRPDRIELFDTEVAGRR